MQNDRERALNEHEQQMYDQIVESLAGDPAMAGAVRLQQRNRFGLIAGAALIAVSVIAMLVSSVLAAALWLAGVILVSRRIAWLGVADKLTSRMKAAVETQRAKRPPETGHRRTRRPLDE